MAGVGQARAAGRSRRRSAPAEQSEQEHLDLMVRTRIPELYRHMTATPLGGLRNIKTARDLKRAGVSKGYPDVLIDLPRGPFHGMRVELKRQDGVPSHVKPEQREWGERLNQAGFLAVVGWGAEHAFGQVWAYWQLGDFHPGAYGPLEAFCLLGLEVEGRREREARVAAVGLSADV